MNVTDDVEWVERVDSPAGELALRRRGGVFEIISNGVFLMDTGDGRSERRLADLAVASSSSARSKETRAVRRVLVAGIGVGFTLAQVLAYPDVENVTVIEIEEAIVKWNRGPLATINGRALDDPRVRVVVADLRSWLLTPGDRFDAICMDVDNGPDWTVTESNSWLYTPEALALLSSRLTDGGRLTIWSASAAVEFERLLGKCFSIVRCESIDARRGPPDVVFFAQL
ncbi:MAG: spermidine synthase [Acidothermaceae bacterium]